MHYVWHRSEQKNATLRLPPRSAAPRRAPETRFILFMFLAASAPASWRSGLWFVCLPPPRRIWRTARRRVHGRVSFLFPRRLHSAPPKLPVSGRAVIQRGGAGPVKQVRSRLSKSQSDFSRLSKLHQARLWGFFNRRCHLMMTSSFKAAVKLNDDEPDSASICRSRVRLIDRWLIAAVDGKPRGIVRRVAIRYDP